MTKAAESVWTAEPFRLGTIDDFTRVREALARSGFTEPGLCARANVRSIAEFARGSARSVLREIEDPQSLLVHLFIDEEAVPWTIVRKILSSEQVDSLRALDLLRDDRSDAEQCVAGVMLYPTDELYIASDRDERFDASTTVLPVDVVYNALTSNTRRFLGLMPKGPCEDFLDLCSGTGIAALVAALQFARNACAVDITERSTRFAQFNASLNALPNVTALAGDLYAPVAGRTFDRIVAHPPYVPAIEPEYVFRDGGEDGEQITRRIIAGLGEHLRPGGQFFCDCMMTDRKDAPLEQRLREMLGETAEEFDVVVAQMQTFDPTHFVTERIRNGQRTVEQAEAEREVYRRLEITEMVLASILIRRRAHERPVVTSRRWATPLTSADDLQWLLRWCTAVAGWDSARRRKLLDSRPRTLPRTELIARSHLESGQWALQKCTLATSAPFAVEADCPTWFMTLLMWCDGRLTAREHLQHLKDTGMVPDQALEEEFAGMVLRLVDAGMVEIEEFPLPDATAMREARTETIARAD